jgi:hypothetical protein
METRKGQVTIFIVVAIILIITVITFFLFRLNVIPEIGGSSGEDPNKFFSTCIESEIEDVLQLILENGGYISPENHLLYNNKTIAYLCYNKNYYQSCINQEPVYIKHLESEIKSYVSDEIRNCFDELAINLEKKGYVVNAKYNGFEVNVVPKKIIIDINAQTTLTKSGETNRQDDFSVVKPSGLFEIANVAREIINQESKYCSFEYLGYMLFYPQYSIDKKAVGQGATASKIYTVENEKTREKLNFAVRGCEIPPGF